MKTPKFNVGQLILLGIGGLIGIVGDIAKGVQNSRKKPINKSGVWICPRCNFSMKVANYKELYCDHCRSFFVNPSSPYCYDSDKKKWEK